MQLLLKVTMKWFHTIILNLILEEDGTAAKNKLSNAKDVNQFILQNLMVCTYVQWKLITYLCIIVTSLTIADDWHSRQTLHQLSFTSNSSEETVTEFLGSKRPSQTSTGSLSCSQQSTTTLTSVSKWVTHVLPHTNFLDHLKMTTTRLYYCLTDQQAVQE